MTRLKRNNKYQEYLQTVINATKEMIQMAKEDNNKEIADFLLNLGTANLNLSLYLAKQVNVCYEKDEIDRKFYEMVNGLE